MVWIFLFWFNLFCRDFFKLENVNVMCDLLICLLLKELMILNDLFVLVFVFFVLFYVLVCILSFNLVG